MGSWATCGLGAGRVQAANTHIAVHTTRALEAMEALQANLKREQSLQTELSTEVFKRVQSALPPDGPPMPPSLQRESVK